MKRVVEFIERAIAASTLRVLGGAECVHVDTARAIACEAAEAAAAERLDNSEERRREKLFRCATEFLTATGGPWGTVEMEIACTDALQLEGALLAAVECQERKETADD